MTFGVTNGWHLAPCRVAFLPFTAQTRMSGMDLEGHQYRKGGARYVTAACQRKWISHIPAEPDQIAEKIAQTSGGTPLVVDP